MQQRRRQLVVRGGLGDQLGVRARGDHLRLLIKADHRRFDVPHHPFVVAAGAMDVGQDVVALGVPGNKHIGLDSTGQQHHAKQSCGESFHCSTSPDRPRKMGVMPQWTVAYQPYASTVPKARVAGIRGLHEDVVGLSGALHGNCISVYRDPSADCVRST
ncbi:hypothetical protein D3C72_1527540 [compost metagenome]